MNSEQLEQLKKSYSTIKKKANGESTGDWSEIFVNIPEGPEGLQIRILPSKNSNELFYAETSQHRIHDKNYACLKEKDEKCPVCEVYYALWKTKDDDNIKLARSIKPKKKFYMNAFERESGKVKIFTCGIKLMEQIMGVIFDDDYGDITDPQTGRDFKLVRKIVSGWNNYDDSRPKPLSTKLANTQQEEDQILAEGKELSTFVKYPTYEEMEEQAALILSETSSGPSSEETNLLLD